MAKKIGILILVIFLSIIIASIYGILHNQISYSISSEYFTKFKFEQLGFWDYAFGNNNRKKIAFIGILATWWFGLLIGLIHGIVGLFQQTHKIMWKSTLGAIIWNLGIAIGIGIIGILIGKFIVANLNLTWDFPADLIDKKNFIAVGTMHEFSYVGGIIGLIYGILYQLKIKNSQNQ